MTEPAREEDDSVGAGAEGANNAVRNVRGGGFLFRHFLHSDANFAKLKTREDPYHLHKTLGISSVLMFFFRYAYVYNTQGTLGFDGRRFDWFTMLLHTCLSFSSLLFRVPSKRIAKKPMVIYEEYRQHTMAFTVRCVCVFALATLYPNSPVYVCPLVILANHLVVDLITRRHGTPGDTAVRSNKKTEDSLTKQGKLSSLPMRIIPKFYSFYQFLALASILVPNARLADMGYNFLIAIQSSAFLMTLYRKRIIRGKAHLVLYTFCLALSGYHICLNMKLVTFLITVAAFTLRVYSPREVKGLDTKYPIWCLFLATCCLMPGGLAGS